MMGKRSDFVRRPNDIYRTFDPRAVAALRPHLLPHTQFHEPCAGDGVLIDQLVAEGHTCVGAWDINPKRDDILNYDATSARVMHHVQCFITNPPWTRPILHDIIVNLSDQSTTWLLFDADWLHTKQSTPYLPRLRKVVSVGRLKWIEGSKMDGKDNCCWYAFTRPSDKPTLFCGRT